jgi:hypothetical protein
MKKTAPAVGRPTGSDTARCGASTAGGSEAASLAGSPGSPAAACMQHKGFCALIKALRPTIRNKSALCRHLEPAMLVPTAADGRRGGGGNGATHKPAPP